MNDKMIMEAAQLEQNSEALRENIEYIDSQIHSLESFKESLESLSKSSDEFLANVGPGVFLKSKLLEKELFVQVGSDVVIKKTPEETLDTVKEQISRIKEARMNLLTQIDLNASRFNQLIEEISKQESAKEKEKN